jgi:hypothetical protein
MNDYILAIYANRLAMLLEKRRDVVSRYVAKRLVDYGRLVSKRYMPMPTLKQMLPYWKCGAFGRLLASAHDCGLPFAAWACDQYSDYAIARAMHRAAR